MADVPDVPGISAAARVRVRRTAAALVAVVAAVVVATGVLLHRRAGVVGADGQAPGAARAVAVLPFGAADGDAAGRALAESVTVAVGTALARVPGLRVAAPPAADPAAPISGDPRAHGRALGVALLLDGDVARAGGRVRVRARLTSARESAAIWHGAFEADAADRGAVGDSVARGVAAALRLGRGGGAGAP